MLDIQTDLMNGAYLQQLVDVVSDVVIHQGRVQCLEVCVVHILKHEAWGLGLRISDHIKQPYDVCASDEVLQNLNLSLDLQVQLHQVSSSNTRAMRSMLDNLSVVTFFFFTGFKILMMHF